MSPGNFYTGIKPENIIENLFVLFDGVTHLQELSTTVLLALVFQINCPTWYYFELNILWTHRLFSDMLQIQ